MKKLYSALAIVLLMLVQLVPVMAEEIVEDDKLSLEPYSTAQYYWWKQDSNTYLRLENNGGWLNHGDPFYATKGQSICFTPQSSAPTIGIDISIAGKVLAGGISYTPGSSHTVIKTVCDVPFPSSGTFQAQYLKKYAVYSIKQSCYYYEFGTDYYQYSKTGTLKVNTTPQYRHVKK